MSYPLCAVIPQIGVLSETFVDWDVNELLPGRTAVLAGPSLTGKTLRDSPSWTTSAPTLAFDPQPGSPLPDMDTRAAVAQFLKEHGAEVALVQFLSFAQHWFETLSGQGIQVWLRGHGVDISAQLSTRYREFGKANGILVPCASAKQRLTSIGLSASQIHVVPNHVAVAAAAPAARPVRDEVRCVSVGRLVGKKGHRYLLEAFAKAVAVRPELRLDIIGDGPLRAELQEFITSAGLTGLATLHGPQPPAQVAARIAAADMFAHHAVIADDGDAETMPLVILEAMATGLPVILTRNEGLVEIDPTGRAAIYVSERDVGATAGALIALAADPALRAGMGAAAWEIARDNFSHEAVRPQLLDLLDL